MNFLKATLLISVCCIFNACSSVKYTEDTLPYPKNIIIFIGDGMGYNHILAANYYEHGEANSQVYEQNDWVKFAMATYNAVLEIQGGDTIFAGGYNPYKAWTDSEYLKTGHTDSGAGATAISTGKKTFDRSIGIGIFGDTLTHISEIAKKLGKSIGVATTVPISHATPAGFLTHNVNRDNYEEIAKSLLFRSYADIIMGSGNPDYNNSGKEYNSKAKYVGGRELWDQLLINDQRLQFVLGEDTFYVKDANGDGKPDPWHLIQTREEFISLIENPLHNRILGVAQAYNALQSNREFINEEFLPYDNPFNENVPQLKEMTQATLSILSKNKNGFFAMIEGGTIDWASHDNYSQRTIEEQIEFNNAIKAAVEWVEKYSSWEETLIIVTADHECGYLTGPSHPQIVNSKVKNTGKGNLPLMKWNSTDHTNQLVPFFAKGPGAELFEIFADEYDPKRGPFIQNTEIAQLIFLLWGKR
ncbi:MAG: alkaline phosphatase [Bacteroidetes bacterium]|nr:alkaline phosphatase [Bacteroidota bacterium]